MSMSQGSVSVDQNGNVTGSGAALYVYNQLLTVQPWVGVLAESGLAGTVLVGIKQEIAAQANAVAILIPYIVANAQITNGTLVAHVTNQSLGLTPSPNNANTAIQPPASPVDIPLTGAGALT